MFEISSRDRKPLVEFRDFDGDDFEAHVADRGCLIIDSIAGPHWFSLVADRDLARRLSRLLAAYAEDGDLSRAAAVLEDGPPAAAEPDIRDRIEELALDQDDHEGRIAVLELDLRDFRADSGMFAKEVLDRVGTVEDWQRNRNDIGRRLRDAEENIGDILRLLAEDKAVEATISEHPGRLDQLERRLDVVDDVTEGHRAAISNLKYRSECLSGRVDVIEKKVADLSGQVADAEDKADPPVGQDDHEARLKDLAERVDAIDRHHAVSIDALSDLVKAAKAAIENPSGRLALQKAELACLDLQEVERRLAAIEAAIKPSEQSPEQNIADLNRIYPVGSRVQFKTQLTDVWRDGTIWSRFVFDGDRPFAMVKSGDRPFLPAYHIRNPE